MIIQDYDKGDDGAEKAFLEESFIISGINTKQCIWLNAVNCSLKKQMPKKKEIENCKIYLDYAIEAFRPLYIIIVGNTAFNSLNSKILNKEHGKWFFIRDNIPAIGIYSLSMIENVGPDLADSMAKELDEDLLKIKERILIQYPECNFLINK